MLPGGRLRVAVWPACRGGEAVAVQKVSRVAKAQILRQKRDMGSGGGVGVSVDPETGIIDVIRRCAGSLPGHLVIAEAGPAAAGLPNATPNTEHLVQIEAPTHS